MIYCKKSDDSSLFEPSHFKEWDGERGSNAYEWEHGDWRWRRRRLRAQPAPHSSATWPTWAAVDVNRSSTASHQLPTHTGSPVRHTQTTSSTLNSRQAPRRSMAAERSLCTVIIIIIITEMIFIELSSWQSHCDSSPGPFDECRLGKIMEEVRKAAAKCSVNTQFLKNNFGFDTTVLLKCIFYRVISIHLYTDNTVFHAWRRHDVHMHGVVLISTFNEIVFHKQ